MKMIVYISQAAHWVALQEVAELVEQSASNNRLSDLTGLLIFDGRRFIQAIEGEADAVDATMARIRADRRHHAIGVVIDQATSARSFAEWSLLYQDASPGAELERFRTTLKRNVAGIADPAVQALFIGFANLGHARPARRLDAARNGGDQTVPGERPIRRGRSEPPHA